jgi:glycosyltransferase involved in cell wall biosynthesis/acetyltransferase-like isoleucine patch superfamily enzyme
MQSDSQTLPHRDASSSPLHDTASTHGIFQRLDTVNPYPYTLREYAKRFAWEYIGQNLVRYSFRRATRFRRWLLRMFGGQCTDTSYFKNSTLIRHPWLLKMGQHTTLAEDVEIYNLGPVEIGDHSVVSQRAYICAGTHDYTYPSLPLVRPSIRIGSGVWICAGAFIGPGVTIGDNSVIGAYAVVTKDVPPDSIVAGNPGKVIKKRPMRFEERSTGAERPLHITVVMGPFLPAPPAACGAVEFLWMGLSERFAEQGHKVTVLCRGHESQNPDETINDVRYIRRTMFRRSKLLFLDLFKDLMYSLRMLGEMPPADILVTNTFWTPVLARFRPGAGQIVVCVNRVPKGQFRLYKGAARLQAVSQAIADAVIAEVPTAKQNVKIIPNPIDMDIFVPPKTPRFEGATKTILFTGRLHPEKGVHVLVEAFASLHQTRPWLRLKLVGPSRVEQGGGGDEYINQLKHKAQGLPVEFCAPVFGRPELAKVLQDADFYVYPTLAEKGEALPVAPLEAMATGLAPVVSDIPQFRDYIVPGETGLVYDWKTPKVAANLAAALATLIDDPELARKMGEKAVTKASEFSYQRVTDMFVSDFREILARQKPQPVHTGR